jgi:hypothetical protein
MARLCLSEILSAAAIGLRSQMRIMGSGHGCPEASRARESWTLNFATQPQWAKFRLARDPDVIT